MTSRGVHWIVETPRLQYIVDNQFIDGSQVVSLTRWPPSPPFAHKNIPGNHFCYRLSRTQVYSAVGWIISSGKYDGLVGNRTNDLPACSTVPRLSTRQRAPLTRVIWIQFGYRAY
jgi:hypothetical protein